MPTEVSAGLTLAALIILLNIGYRRPGACGRFVRGSGELPEGFLPVRRPLQLLPDTEHVHRP